MFEGPHTIVKSKMFLSPLQNQFLAPLRWQVLISVSSHFYPSRKKKQASIYTASHSVMHLNTSALIMRDLLLPLLFSYFEKKKEIPILLLTLLPLLWKHRLLELEKHVRLIQPLLPHMKKQQSPEKLRDMSIKVTSYGQGPCLSSSLLCLSASTGFDTWDSQMFAHIMSEWLRAKWVTELRAQFT